MREKRQGDAVGDAAGDKDAEEVQGAQDAAARAQAARGRTL